MNNSIRFFNRCFDKKRLKNFILWFFSKYGERETIQLIESLKEIGFQYATKAGISIGIDDLKIPFIKSDVINITEQKIKGTEINYQRGHITEIERQQQFVDEWNFVSEKLKRHVIQFFKATDLFNPIYMMAFSGARGNISQIRQLIGMRGLMADPQGQILDFPIRSSFREGLTLTEYLISCYGARKGVVDTALRTATSGYLTRRLVDVTQQVVIGRQNCYTTRGVEFTNLIDGTKVLLSLKDRLIGRVLLNDIVIRDRLTKKKYKIGSKNQEISASLSKKIYDTNDKILLRSPLTCFSKNSICQLCYGWNLAYNAIVSIGEAVGVLAAQSIGEPGTQLTMRTFHTGGVFTGGLIDQIYAPFSGEVNYINNFKGVLIRTIKGRVGFLTKTEGALQVKTRSIKYSNIINLNYKTELTNLFFSSQLKIKSLNKTKIHLLLNKILEIEKNLKAITKVSHPHLVFNIPIHTILFARHGSSVLEKELIAELSSLSISDSRRQETEQEVFTPTSGQIFFENLLLIEKTKRDGSIQKMTYGLGSVWVIGSTEWRPLISPSIFPSCGDLISNSSVIQELKIRIEKFYYFNKSKLYFIRNLKSNFLLTNRNIKTDPLENILLIRTFYSSNFRTIYYQSFRYFALINVNILNNFFNYSSYLNIKNKNLSLRDQFTKNHQSKYNLNSLLLSLNFRFYQNIPISKIRRSKSNFLICTLQHAGKSKYGYFFSLVSFYLQLKTKLKSPIFSRKIPNSQGKQIKVLNKAIYQYWFYNYSFSFINLLSEASWCFSKKKLYTNFDFRLSNQNNNFYSLNKYFCETQKSTFQQKEPNPFQFPKIFKFFITTLQLTSCSLSFSWTQILKALPKLNWITSAQRFSILINRQSVINWQLSKLWYLSEKNTFQAYLPYRKMDVENASLKRLEQLSKYIYNSSPGTFYNIKESIKPILIHPGLLINFYNKKFFLQSYITQNFLIYFYYDRLSNLKFENFFFNSFKKGYNKIGFQTQFKVSTIPIFVNNNTSYLQIPSKIKSIFFQNEIFIFLQKNNLLKPNHKKKQSYLYWPCTHQGKKFIKKFGYFLNFGSKFEKNIFFDRQQVLVDIIYNEFFCKFNLLNFFSYKRFHKLKMRFTAHRLFSKKLVIFQKVENQINQNIYYSKIINLNNNHKNKEYHNSLAFNFVKNYFTNFNYQVKQKKNLFNLFYFDNIVFFSSKKLFLKIGFSHTLQVKTKTLFNFEYPISIKTYCPLRKRGATIFKFSTSKLGSQKNKAYAYILNDFMLFASKNICFNSLQKLNIPSVLNKKIKNINRIKIFYKNFENASFSNEITIQFFAPSIEGEIICTNSKKQKLGINVVILTQQNLKTFNLANTISSRILMLGNFLRYGNKFENQKTISTGGQIIYLDKKSFAIRQAIPFLITSKSLINVYQDEVISKGSRLFTFLSHRLKTGDIIQGIPKIEEFFEARLTREGLPILKNLHTQIKQLFQTYSSKFSIFEATQKSFEKIQYLIIDEIQKIYCSQGVYISDKHIEIVVRQMTSKVKVIKGGQTGLLCGEIIELDWIHVIERKFENEEILYEPIILGITKSCLETESFIAAASFQETTRILTKAAIQNKIDFIRGLKQNVILGNLVPAGTGFFSPLYIKYSKID